MYVSTIDCSHAFLVALYMQSKLQDAVSDVLLVRYLFRHLSDTVSVVWQQLSDTSQIDFTYGLYREFIEEKGLYR